MSTDSTYCYKGKHFVIENGVLIDTEEPLDMEDITNFGEPLLQRLRANPLHIAQIDAVTGKEVTFAEMEENSVKCAMWLREQNIQPGDIIGVCTHNQPDMYVPCFASLYVGAICNPWLAGGLTIGLTKHFLTLTSPKFVFVDEASSRIVLEAVEELGVKTEIIVFGKLPGFRSLEDILTTLKTNLVPEFRCTNLTSCDEPASIIYTSGSTGLSKGAVFSHKSLYGNVFRCTKDETMLEEAKSMHFSPLAWLSAYLHLYRVIFLRLTRILYPKYSEEKCLELIEKYKVDWMFLGTSSVVRLQMWLSKTNYDLSSLKILLVGGAAMKENTQTTIAKCLPQTKFYQGYATTEMGCIAFCQRPGTKVKQGSCGTICMGVIMKMIDPEIEKVLGPNQTGEICMKSPFMTTGYLQNPEATRTSIDSEGWLHTGDLGYYDQEGDLFFVSRSKDMIKYREIQVPPAMVEEVLQTHPQVREVAVLGIPHNDDGEHPIAFVTKTPNADVTEEDLKKLVEDTLPDYMRLRGGVKFLSELPHTPSGKIAKSELQKLAKSYACE